MRAPAERCFDLARSVEAHVRSLADTGERVVAATGELLEAGDVVTWEARHFGVRQRFTARITELRRPSEFTDEMVRGAFASFRHVHRFVATAEGTRVIDDLEYRAPLGPLGLLADALVLRPYLRRLLRRRAEFLRGLAESGAPDGPSAPAVVDRGPRP